MAPKTRSGKVLGTVVTRKVVEETVEAVVSPGESEGGRVGVVSQSFKENEKVEVISSSAKGRGPVKKVVVVGSKADEEDRQPPQEQPEEGPEQLQHEQEDQDEQPQRQQLEEEQQEEEEEQAEAGKQPAEEGIEQQQDEEELQEESEAEDDETQPASQPEVTPAPTPPKYEAPPRKEEEERSKKRKHEEAKAVKENQKKNTAQKGVREETGKRRKKRAKVGGRVGSDYKRYVFRVMKQVHPDMGISSKAMTIINNLMSDMFERIADEASKLSKYVGRATLSSIEIQDAVKLVLPGDLGKHAIAEGSKAVTNYVTNVTGNFRFKTKSKSKS